MQSLQALMHHGIDWWLCCWFNLGNALDWGGGAAEGRKKGGKQWDVKGREPSVFRHGGLCGLRSTQYLKWSKYGGGGDKNERPLCPREIWDTNTRMRQWFRWNEGCSQSLKEISEWWNSVPLVDASSLPASHSCPWKTLAHEVTHTRTHIDWSVPLIPAGKKRLAFQDADLVRLVWKWDRVAFLFGRMVKLSVRCCPSEEFLLFF